MKVTCLSPIPPHTWVPLYRMERNRFSGSSSLFLQKGMLTVFCSWAQTGLIVLTVVGTCVTVFCASCQLIFPCSTKKVELNISSLVLGVLSVKQLSSENGTALTDRRRGRRREEMSSSIVDILSVRSRDRLGECSDLHCDIRWVDISSVIMIHHMRDPPTVTGSRIYAYK